MPWYADLHVHSRFAAAIGRALTLPALADGARVKGLSLLGTGDITHPAWQEECRAGLEADDAGLYACRGEAGTRGLRTPRFVPSAEVTTVSRRDARTQRIDHLLLLPSLEAAARVSRVLARWGEFARDGRPTLAVSPRELVGGVLDRVSALDRPASGASDRRVASSARCAECPGRRPPSSAPSSCSRRGRGAHQVDTLIPWSLNLFVSWQFFRSYAPVAQPG